MVRDPVGERPVASDALEGLRELGGRALEQGGACRLRHVAAEATAGVAFLELETQLAGVERLDAVHELCPLDVGASDRTIAGVGEWLVGVRAGAQRSLDLLLRDPPRGAQRAVVVVGQVAAASQHQARLGDRLVEGKVLQAMERVVVDERGDRPLRREQVAGVLDHVPEVVAQFVG